MTMLQDNALTQQTADQYSTLHAVFCFINWGSSCRPCAQHRLIHGRVCTTAYQCIRVCSVSFDALLVPLPATSQD